MNINRFTYICCLKGLNKTDLHSKSKSSLTKRFLLFPWKNLPKVPRVWKLLSNPLYAKRLMISAFELAYVAPRRRASLRWPENRSFIAMRMMWDNHFGESTGPFWSFCFMSCHTGFLDYLDNLEVFYLSWWRHLQNNNISSAACWFCTCARSIGESLSQWSNKRTELEGRLHQLNHLTKLSYSFPYLMSHHQMNILLIQIATIGRTTFLTPTCHKGIWDRGNGLALISCSRQGICGTFH